MRGIKMDGWRTRTLLLIGLVAMTGCSGPQSLSVAIRPEDESAYKEALRATKRDGRLAFANWMARERSCSPDDVLAADARLSTTHNPFDANKDPKAVSRGAVMYKIHCKKCHGKNADGNGSSVLEDYPAKNFRGFSVRAAVTLWGGAYREWFRRITEGHGELVEYPEGESLAMPAYGKKLTREQIWLVTTYLQSLDAHAEVRSTP